MLVRGQSLVGYRHYPDDVVDAFIKKAIDDGIDVVRVFDALNDVRNMERAIKSAKEAGAIVKGAISYTISPVHTIDKYIEIAKQLADLNVDIISIKDMAGAALAQNGLRAGKAPQRGDRSSRPRPRADHLGACDDDLP